MPSDEVCGERQKLLIIVYDRAIDEDMMSTIERVGVNGYTKFLNAHGLGGRGLKLGNPIFPGLNNLLLIQLQESKVNELIKAIREMQAQYVLKPGITIWCLDVQIF
ncbi:MAG: hypothetical protein RMK18_00655 [Armatimonadota bacterium]|nr:hypothetical protein [Armatimonadota bacterium]MCX7777319.1 hypothetical protein [Armatimonadota bacterium]MDW8024364.1 hypothetical protein [Armatimonadota bacterium]